MGNTRFKGANSGEKLIQSTVLDDDQLQVRHAVGTINDVDKGLSKAIVQSTNIAVCSTASATTAKTATIQNFPDFTLLPGREVLVYFANKNTAENPTLNINNTGAFPISLESLAYTSRSEKDLWAAGSFVRVKYVDITVSGTRIQCWVMTPSQNALNGALTNFVGNKSVNGYVKLPTGLILQWGETSITASGSDTTYTTFPIAFPNNCLNVTGTHLSYAGLCGSIYIVNYDKDQIRWFAQNVGAISWMAIGY